MLFNWRGGWDEWGKKIEFASSTKRIVHAHGVFMFILPYLCVRPLPHADGMLCQSSTRV